ncbi:cyclic GMP-AMP synthase-like protein isoform X2 [Eupeodes corollae]|uniref:cyclic GMP-AMP synthase-like protein isoform X2 n=1 Tax=Eupeodes corollae TaxID=290404 RepID=UPI0024916DD7|nr:cyclic GMP-AMP synthase-like protein isoform X2 [Eupeodes corollae]
MNFEGAISQIDNEISVKKEDRESYTKDFDKIRNHLLKIMELTDEVFKKIYGGPSLFGSFLENMKILAPDEFDVHFLLKLPFYEDIVIQKDALRPGYVKLLISKPLMRMKQNKDYVMVYEQFNQFVTSSGHLLRCEIQHWLERIIIKAFRTYGNSLPNYDETDVYKLIYLKRGTAHTIKAFSQSRNISIDFVPAFKFNADKTWLAERPFPNYVKEKLWFAVPKPSVGPKNGRKLTFSICVPQTEKHLLMGKYNLKPTLRLMKSMRDRIDSDNCIKSYFIKSIYLHENENQDDEFWMQSPGKLLIHMLDRLLFCLENKSIEFYWCGSMNLLASLDDCKTIKLTKTFQRVRNRLDTQLNQLRRNSYNNN